MSERDEIREVDRQARNKVHAADSHRWTMRNKRKHLFETGNLSDADWEQDKADAEAWLDREFTRIREWQDSEYSRINPATYGPAPAAPGAPEPVEEVVAPAPSASRKRINKWGGEAPETPEKRLSVRFGKANRNRYRHGKAQDGVRVALRVRNRRGQIRYFGKSLWFDHVNGVSLPPDRWSKHPIRRYWRTDLTDLHVEMIGNAEVVGHG